MTNILSVLPEFDVRPFTHILPSLEKALISTADLLSLDALHVAKRASVPSAEVKKLTTALLESLHSEIAASQRQHHPRLVASAPDGRPDEGNDAAAPSANHAPRVSSLDDRLDNHLGGGIAPGYLTEVVGESAAGKTQFLLTLLLSVQLHPDQKSALYISTEAPLQTTRLTQILTTHPYLSTLPPAHKPSLSRVHVTHIHDLEAQDHILRYQVPVALRAHDIGLLVIDSVAANYRAELDRTKPSHQRGGGGGGGGVSYATRNHHLLHLGAHLRHLATTFHIPVVVANQVADRFTTPDSATTSTAHPTPMTLLSKGTSTRPQPHGEPIAPVASVLSTDDPLALDHQLRFFTGWGDAHPTEGENLKTPSLGLAWTNQLATRLAFLKEPVYADAGGGDGEREVVAWRRRVKCVFSAWCVGSECRFEIWEGGVRGVEVEV